MVSKISGTQIPATHQFDRRTPGPQGDRVSAIPDKSDPSATEVRISDRAVFLSSADEDGAVEQARLLGEIKKRVLEGSFEIDYHRVASGLLADTIAQLHSDIRKK